MALLRPAPHTKASEEIAREEQALGIAGGQQMANDRNVLFLDTSSQAAAPDLASCLPAEHIKLIKPTQIRIADNLKHFFHTAHHLRIHGLSMDVCVLRRASASSMPATSGKPRAASNACGAKPTKPSWAKRHVGPPACERARADDAAGGCGGGHQARPKHTCLCFGELQRFLQ